MRHQLKVEYAHQLTQRELQHYLGDGLLALPPGREHEFLHKGQPFTVPRANTELVSPVFDMPDGKFVFDGEHHTETFTDYDTALTAARAYDAAVRARGRGC
jgi:predicted oxidoreductase